MRILFTVSAVIGVCLFCREAHTVGEVELVTITGGANCMEADGGTEYCNSCPEKQRCTSTTQDELCKTYENPYGCAACTVSNVNCAFRLLEFQVTGCAGDDTDIGPCNRTVQDANQTGCDPVTTVCPAIGGA